MSSEPTEPLTSESPVSHRRMENFDALRILAMLVIMCTHVIEPYIDDTYFSLSERFKDKENIPDSAFSPLFKILLSINVACRFGVPCFLMISFYIYWQQLYIKGRSWPQLVYRRAKRLIPAFLFWSTFYFLLHNRVYAKTGQHPGPLGLWVLQWKNLDVLKDVFLFGRAEIHLYYLPTVIISLLLIPVLRFIWPKPIIAWTTVALFLAFWVFVFYGSALIPASSPLFPWTQNALRMCQKYLAFPLLVFPLMGMMFAGQTSLKKLIVSTPTALWVGLLIFGIAFHIAETLFLLKHDFLMALSGLKPGRYITAIAIFVLFLRSPMMRDPFPSVSHHAFGLHFLHPAVILGLLLIESKLLSPSITNWQSFVIPILILNFILTFTITYALCRLISRSKQTEFLVV